MYKKLCAILIFVAIFLSGCSTESINGGEVGVIQDKPFFFGNEGFREHVEPQGRVVTWLTSDIHKVFIAPQTIRISVDDLMSKDKVPLDFDIAVTIESTSPETVWKMLSQYGGGVTHTFNKFVLQGTYTQEGVLIRPTGEFMSHLRDKVKTYAMDEYVVGQTMEGKTSSASKDTEESLVSYVNSFLESRGVEIRVVNIALGRAIPPQGVKDSMERTAEQIQRVRTEAEREQAEISRKNAEKAAADADKQYMEELGITSEQYLKIRELQMVENVCGKSAKDLKDNDQQGNKPRCMLVYGQALPTISTSMD
ncbi:MAG: SPFH domain-containing protein [Candidatus Nomurabacteria bacterium]|nr:SPFH domain-containing protein [Candidatus Nomurabacteria bacterium]USN87731.1 MAG: SPFH domain-containing protein [Candidatus Nomurabacteria bacterium]